jgi:hypothetical protein
MGTILVGDRSAGAKRCGKLSVALAAVQEMPAHGGPRLLHRVSANRADDLTVFFLYPAQIGLPFARSSYDMIISRHRRAEQPRRRDAGIPTRRSIDGEKARWNGG